MHGTRLERQKIDRKCVPGAEDASKNRWRKPGIKNGPKRYETRMLAVTANVYT